jgi:hypothetical protein
MEELDLDISDSEYNKSEWKDFQEFLKGEYNNYEK